MLILVIDDKMPESCKRCRFCGYDELLGSHYCPCADEAFIWPPEERTSKCPLREIKPGEWIMSVTGEWIGLEYDGYADGHPVYDVWECSNCHEEYEGDRDSLPRYCPNCGARMEAKE